VRERERESVCVCVHAGKLHTTTAVNKSTKVAMNSKHKASWQTQPAAVYSEPHSNIKKCLYLHSWILYAISAHLPQ